MGKIVGENCGGKLQGKTVKKISVAK